MERWNKHSTNIYCRYNILKKPEVVRCQIKYFTNKCHGKKILELGSGEGLLSQNVKALAWINVDPYVDSRDVVKNDAIDYLNNNQNARFDVVISCFALHHFYQPNLKCLIENILKPGGKFINSQISLHTQFFGDGEFNRIFFSQGFDVIPLEYNDLQIENIKIHISYQDFLDFILNRTWSNLAKMNDDDINFLVERIPKTLKYIELTIERQIVYGKSNKN